MRIIKTKFCVKYFSTSCWWAISEKIFDTKKEAESFREKAFNMPNEYSFVGEIEEKELPYLVRN